MAGRSREQILLIATILVVGVLLLDKLVLTPMIGVWNERSVRIERLEREIAAGEPLARSGGTLRARWREYLEHDLPATRSEGEKQVLELLAEWRASSGIEQSNLRPSWSQGVAKSDRLAIRFSGVGNLRTIAEFIHALEADATALRVEELTLDRRDERGRLLSLDMTVSGVALDGVGS